MTQSKPETKNSDKHCELQGVYENDTLLYRHIYQSIGAPDWAGYNLDALFDVLTSVVDGPIQIVWTGFEHVEKEQIDMNLTVAALIEEASKERPDLHFTKNT